MLLIFFFLIFFNLMCNNNAALNVLLIAELLWITLYLIALFVGITFNNLNILSLTFFFLVFSAIELGIGLVLLLFQTVLNRSTSLNQNDVNTNKIVFFFSKQLYVTKTKWKI